ncbi:MAG: MarR family transcriptional regulator [Clostridia bacterium]|nr:MarR family transcriptional regulator [Clostridia bacterium]MBR2926178.1 MarR family transcriptional regulator [Clostridia bacterium]
MFEGQFLEVYTKFKVLMYKKIFSSAEAQNQALTAMEHFCAETIYVLNRPTILEFARFVNISAPNAVYKINNLMKKGYIVKVRSEQDRREYHLEVTEKYLQTYGSTYSYVDTVMKRIRQRFSPEDAEKFGELLRVINEELMPEATEGIENARF